MELINKIEFAKTVLDKESETFLVHVFALEALSRSAKMTMYPSQAAHIAVIKQDGAFIKVPLKYANYANIFSFHLAIELSTNSGINKHAIKLQKGKQPTFRPIYSLKLVELETLKIYIGDLP